MTKITGLKIFVHVDLNADLTTDNSVPIAFVNSKPMYNAALIQIGFELIAAQADVGKPLES